jgi:SAM-dependent methyltransferase
MNSVLLANGMNSVLLPKRNEFRFTVSLSIPLSCGLAEQGGLCQDRGVSGRIFVNGVPIVSYSHTKTNDRVLELVAGGDVRNWRIIDVGAGEGFFSQMLGEVIRRQYGIPPSTVLRACDLFPEHFKYADVPCDQVNLDHSLPYAADSFDVACSIEVVEHIENQFAYVRELHRIVKPGGRAIVTTPNILNINSRLRFFHSGFWLLFDPLPLSSNDPVTLAGHIHPVSFYYLAAMMRRAGFREVRLHFDRAKKSGLALALLCYPFIALPHWLFLWRLRRKSASVYEENRPLLTNLNRLGMLSSRTIVVEAVK